MIKHILITILCILQFAFCNLLQAQNLVPNPSFEEGSCPTDQCQIYYANGWLPMQYNPDYFNSCGQPDWSTPYNCAGFQQAATGNAYAGIGIAVSSPPGTGVSECIGIRLLDSLTIGAKYYVSFKVSLANDFYYATNKLGARFSKRSYEITPYLCGGNGDTINIFPHNYAQVYTDNIISDTTGWTVISGSFIADSAYKYLMIGVFFDESMVSHTIVNPASYNYNAYYYIDDVYVSKDSITSIVNYQENQPTIDLFPNPASDKISFQISEPYKQCNITITDILGKEVQKRILIYPEKDIALNEINSGIYFIKVEVNNKTVIKKIVVEK